VVANPFWTPPPQDTAALISYSQNAEDIRLWRVFGRINNGFYVDIGAADPSVGSVSRIFYDNGWSGINVEPSPAFDALSAERERDVNLQVAVSESEGSAPFFLAYPDLGLSTGDRSVHGDRSEEIEHFAEITVPTRRLDSILRDYAPQTIHFLKVDVEGAEREVLASSDWEAFRPVVVLVEAVETWSTTTTYEAWEHILLGADYEFAAFDGINRFYVDRDHVDLVPALAYPISVLDRFVTASARDREVAAEEAENRFRRAEERGRSESERLRRALAQAQVELAEARQETARIGRSLERAWTELTRARRESERLGRAFPQAQLEVAEAKQETARIGAELERAWQRLEIVYSSSSWRTGRMIAAAGRPAVKLARGAWRHQQATPYEERPSRAYAAFVDSGQPWHLSQKPARRRTVTSPLEDIFDRFGPSTELVDVSRASALAAEVERTGWANEESLRAERPWEDRQAIVEADAIVGLVTARQDDPPNAARQRAVSTRPAVVVDARCLQDPGYATRGIGRHARAVLRAARMAATGHHVFLLTSAELPDLDDEVSELADDVVVTPYALRLADVPLFVQLSPMTATCTATVPFLAHPTCATASVLYDFIPTAFPDAYLSSANSALTNRARTEALRHYDLLLAISRSTEAACLRNLGKPPAISVTGVGDPLHGARPTLSTVDGPYMLVPAGGDPRKNTPAAVAALAQHRRTERDASSSARFHRGRRTKLLRAIITGRLDSELTSALIDLTGVLGLPKDAVQFRGYVGDEELAGLYQSADLAFVPSLLEGFSIPVAEAALRGTPVVASDITAHRELIGAGPWLAPATDIAALAQAIEHVRAHRADVVNKQRAALSDIADPTTVLERIAAALEPLLVDRNKRNGKPLPPSVRPRVAVISPFPPQKSGVADYTAYTFSQVARYADVQVYASAPPGAASSLPIQRVSSAPYLDRRFDAVVNVVGNSHFHFPILDLMGSYGGAAIAHDNRMVESYLHYRGAAWTATLVSRGGRPVRADEIADLLRNLNRLPALGYDVIARQASPLIVHGPSLAERIHRETGVRPHVVPFVPYNVPKLQTIDDAVRERCRQALRFSDDVVNVATFGIVDSRTKGTDLIVGALSWLHTWGRPAHLHIVGEVSAQERKSLAGLAAQLGIAPYVTLHGRVEASTLEEFLLAVDVAVQIRLSTVLSLSGALADCIAFGVPTVTTQDVADEMSTPTYVVTTGSAASSLLIAEAIEELCERRRRSAAAMEVERRDYLQTRTVDAYARGLLEALGLWS
jgi:FkbM family methyltransferase